MGRLVLVTGGVKSGKSAYACRRAEALGDRVLFVATCDPDDRSMRERVARHRAERPAHWTTRESARGVAGALGPGHDAAVVDCLTLLVGQLLGRGAGEDDVLAEVAALADPPCPTFVVTNEVGSGVHPVGELALRFVDVLGRANQLAAARADEVVLLVSGLPLALKGGEAP